GPVLKISRNIHNAGAQHGQDTMQQEAADPQDAQLEASEDDPEALVRTTDSSASLQVEYSVLLSPTYQVPVLYFMLRCNHQGPVGIDAVYQNLVPDQYRKELKNVGVMGGISFDYHPGSGAPTFFVHPCNTADAMRDIAGQRGITPDTYLLIWLGLVGNCVNLHMPCELFATNSMQEDTPMHRG
ncbi:hypothetical protein ASPWEDRAFT_106862, partial [Aspergillus wentii DTO 134E9]